MNNADGQVNRPRHDLAAVYQWTRADDTGVIIQARYGEKKVHANRTNTSFFTPAMSRHWNPRHDAKFVATGGNDICRYDNLRCRHWRQCWYHGTQKGTGMHTTDYIWSIPAEKRLNPSYKNTHTLTWKYLLHVMFSAESVPHISSLRYAL